MLDQHLKKTHMPTSDRIESFVALYPENVRQIAGAARRLLTEVCGGIDESVDTSAKLLAYSYGPGYKGLVCTLIMSRTGVKLGIPYGSQLPDPAGLLIGNGRVHRYVAFASADDVQRSEVRDLVERNVEAWRRRTNGGVG